MSILHSVVLGILQGIAEFFPISSSAHLTLFPWLLGWDDFGENESLRRAFDVALHFGTALALVIHLRDEIYELLKKTVFRTVLKKALQKTPQKTALKKTLKETLQSGKSRSGVQPVRPVQSAQPAHPVYSWSFILKVTIATIPAALVGALLFSSLSDNVTENIWFVSVLLIGFGLLLLAIDYCLPAKKEIDSFSFKDAAFFGLVQALALLPGVSRSGVIITASRMRGFSRSGSVGISFWMAIPILFGAAIYKFIDIDGWGGVPSNMRPAFLVGILTSGVVGFVTLKALTRLVRKLSFTPFVLERILLGSLALILLQTSFR